jgi:hypothetical protein
LGGITGKISFAAESEKILIQGLQLVSKPQIRLKGKAQF